MDIDSCNSRRFRTFLVLFGLTLNSCARETETDQVTEAQLAFEAYLFEFWRDGETDSIRGIFSPNSTYHYNGVEYAGDPDSHIESLQTFGGAFANLTPVVDFAHYTRRGGGVATSWTGTHTAELCGVSASNRTITWPVNYVFRMEAGSIVELWETWDEAAVLRQLGIDVSQC